MKGTIGKRLKQARDTVEMSREQLAHTIGVSHQVISKWERGISEPDSSILFAISKALNRPMEWFMGIDTARVDEPVSSQILRKLDQIETWLKQQTENEPSFPQGKGEYTRLYLPYWGRVPASDWMWEPESEVRRAVIVPLSHAREVNGFVEIFGESMQPTLITGDIVLIKRTKHAPIGKIILARNHIGEVTLKRLQYQAGKIILIPDNPDYEPPLLTDQVEIIGVVVCIIREA